MQENGGIKSKVRVDELGEVLTPEHIVKDMLDLVREESYRVDSTFLEPAAGDGNFLVEILRRKLETAGKLGRGAYDRNLFISLSSIYAIDISNENIKRAKERMIEIVEAEYLKSCGVYISNNMRRVVNFIIEANIIWGDSLNCIREFGSKANVTDADRIVICEWIIEGDMVSRKDYFMEELYGERGKNIPFSVCDKIDFRSIYEQGFRVGVFDIMDIL